MKNKLHIEVNTLHKTQTEIKENIKERSKDKRKIKKIENKRHTN